MQLYAAIILDLLRVCVCASGFVHFFAVRGLCISAQYFAQLCEYFGVLFGLDWLYFRVLGLVVLSTSGDRRCVWEYVEAASAPF